MIYMNQLKELIKKHIQKYYWFSNLRPILTQTHAKQILEAYESEDEFFPTQSPQTGRGVRKNASKENKKTNKKEAEKKKWTRFIF